MTDIMFDIPSNERIKKVIITENTITSGEKPKIEMVPEGEKRPQIKIQKNKSKKTVETA